MKQIKNTLLLIVIAITATMTLSSCGDDNPYYGDYSWFAGRWELTSIDGYPVSEPEVCEFIFWDNGTGSYGQYRPYPQWNESPITWDVDYTGGGATYLTIYPYGGGVWQYLARFRDSYTLELTDLDTGQRLTFIEY